MKGDLASEAQRGYALDVPAQVYELVYLCLVVCARGFTWVAQVGFLVFFLFEHDRDPGLDSRVRFLTIVREAQRRHVLND